jgi:hypothetical protein
MHQHIELKSTKQNPTSYFYLNMQAIKLGNALSHTVKIHWHMQLQCPRQEDK